MKRKIIKITILVLMSISITGCSKNNYQKDESYEADIVGIYEVSGKTDSDDEITYYKQYTLNNDNTYNYEGNVFGVSSESSGNYSISNETSNIIKVDFDIINILSSDEERVNARQYAKMFKYKNMLGDIIEAKDLPTSKTFDYIIPDDIGSGGMVFTKDGYYHACIDIDNCQCDYTRDTKYIKKHNIIYFNTEDSGNDNYWHIVGYIIDDYLFIPEIYKVEE